MESKTVSETTTTTEHRFDAAGQCIQTTVTQMGSHAQWGQSRHRTVTTHEYDAAGRRVRTTIHEIEEEPADE